MNIRHAHLKKPSLDGKFTGVALLTANGLGAAAVIACSLTALADPPPPAPTFTPAAPTHPRQSAHR